MNMERQPQPTQPEPPTEEQPVTMQDLDKYLTDEYEVKKPQRGDLRIGVIIQIDDNGLLVDCGFKREGIVSAEDLEGLDQDLRSKIEVGADIPVFVLQAQNREGQPVLSVQQAMMFEDWLKAEEMLASGELFAGKVSGSNRGGLVVRFGKIRGFIPASQVVGIPRRMREDERRQRLEDMIGKEIGLRVIEVDRDRRRLIFSQRRALRAWQELKRNEVMSTLNEGDVCHGEVTDITDFGAFVDLGGADGLVHVSELSWKRVDNPRQVLKVGQEIDVYVLNVDRQRKRIALSCKKLEPDPWTLVDEQYEIGQLTEGQVTRVLDFGAFVELDLGVEGLLHVSEMIGTPELQPSQIVQPGDTVLVKIIRIESRRKRIALSAKQVRQNEWERWIGQKQAAEEEALEAAEDTAPSAPEVQAETSVTPATDELTIVEVTTESPTDLEVEPVAADAEEGSSEQVDTEPEEI